MLAKSSDRLRLMCSSLLFENEFVWSRRHLPYYLTLHLDNYRIHYEALHLSLRRKHFAGTSDEV